MEFFRGSVAPGLDEEVNAIIESTSIAKCKEGRLCGTPRQLSGSSFFKPFSCIGFLYLAYNISGYSAVSAYSTQYFKDAGAHAASYPAESAILGTVKAIFTVLAPFILTKVSKKKLFVTSGFVSAVAFILGDYFANILVSVSQLVSTVPFIILSASEYNMYDIKFTIQMSFN